MIYIPQCGDVGFVGYDKDSGSLVDAIKRFTTGRGEDVTTAVHQFQVIANNDVMEADGVVARRVIVRTWSERLADIEKNPKAHYIIFRPRLSTYQQEVIDLTGRSLIGHHYGYLELILQAGDGVLQKLGILKPRQPFFGWLGMLVPWTVICSGAGNTCLCRAKLLPKAARFWSPDDTFDEALFRRWTVVGQDEQGLEYWRSGILKSLK